VCDVRGGRPPAPIRGELLIIIDQPDTRPASYETNCRPRRVEGVGHAGFIDINSVDGPDRAAQSGSSHDQVTR
jgi:hypothetical protein